MWVLLRFSPTLPAPVVKPSFTFQFQIFFDFQISNLPTLQSNFLSLSDGKYRHLNFLPLSHVWQTFSIKLSSTFKCQNQNKIKRLKWFFASSPTGRRVRPGPQKDGFRFQSPFPLWMRWSWLPSLFGFAQSILPWFPCASPEFLIKLSFTFPAKKLFPKKCNDSHRGSSGNSGFPTQRFQPKLEEEQMSVLGQSQFGTFYFHCTNRKIWSANTSFFRTLSEKWSRPLLNSMWCQKYWR